MSSEVNNTALGVLLFNKAKLVSMCRSATLMLPMKTSKETTEFLEKELEELQNWLMELNTNFSVLYFNMECQINKETGELLVHITCGCRDALDLSNVAKAVMVVQMSSRASRVDFIYEK